MTKKNTSPVNNSKKPPRKALGRGLNALISSPVVPISAYREETPRSSAPETTQDSNTAKYLSPQSSSNGVVYISVDQIHPNSSQPRKEFDPEELKELADSIVNMGVLQPVIVRPDLNRDDESFELVAGERRWRACKLAKLSQVPAFIKSLSDWESLEIALVENVQRSNLNPVDEAQAYKKLMDQYSLSQSDVAERIGKDRATVANYIRLLNLNPEVLNLLRERSLSMGHAKAILSVKDSQAQLRLAKKALSEGLSVRALESLCSNAAVLEGRKRPVLHRKGSVKSGMIPPGGSDFPELVDRLRKSLGTKVLIKHHSSGRGRIEIEYFSESELDRVVDIIIR